MHSAGADTASAWRSGLPALLLCLVWILFSYRDTALAMVTIWARSETFTHAFLVPPISLWLIWRQRHALALQAPTGGFLMLVPLALAGFAWLLGDLAAVNAVTQLALVSLLVLAVAAVLGPRPALAMLFPLGFLFFAVPIGEFVMPQLMEWTAGFTVGALQFSGVPVYREGLQFVIPSGSWSVVEACSGVRYLIASVTVGTLYAYLNYRSMRRRLIFVAVSFLVPVVANWLRAYMIVMLGHLSGNRLATGVDHLIYGWLFFGVVMLLMFVIGGRWAEHPDAGGRAAAGSGSNATPAGSGRLWLAATAVVVVTGLPLAWKTAIDRHEPANLPGALVLAVPAGWQAVPPATDWLPAFANPTTTLRAEYQQGDRRVGVFVGYYRHQDYERKLVSSDNVLVRSNDPDWARVASAGRQMTLGSSSLAVRTAELRGRNERRLAVWQWYWVAGRWTSSDHLAKAYTALSRLTGRGDDSAVVILYAPMSPADGGEAALEAFVQVAGSAIMSALERAYVGPAGGGA